MANVELIMNSYISPVYVSATNMVTPISTITFDKLYTNALVFMNVLQIGIQTTFFMMKEGVAELITNLTPEKIVYILVVYNLFMLMTIDNHNKKITEQKEIIKSLEKNVIYLKKTERMREDLEEMWVQDVKAYHADTNKKLALFDKKMKKLEKVLKQYE